MSTPDLSSLSPPAGLPDVATLARLAGEFFSALPGASAHAPSLPGTPTPPALGGSPLPSNPQPPGLSIPPGVTGPSTPSAVPFGAIPPGANLVPTSPQSPANAVASAPSLVPHAQAPNGVPDHALVAAPGFDGRSGSHLQGVPEAQAARGPADVPSPSGAAVSASPFYFLSDTGVPGATAPALPANDRVGARPFGLPGDEALRGLLSGGARPTAAPSGFYFIEPSTSTSPGGHGVPQASTSAHPPFDVNAIRRDFPILQERVNGRQLVWFDNAATTQKPQAVIDRLAHFYAHENSNIHRAAHELAARATDAYEGARETVRRFIGAGSVDEIIFVRGTTEAINLVAKSWGAQNIHAGDEIIVSHLEHHANIVPWQQLASAKGAKIRVIPVDDSGQVLLDEYQKLLSDRTKIVSVTQVSNALGTVVPVKQIVDMAHRAGARALVDGAQSVSHMAVDVRALDADFFVFSGHKIFGPTGIGVVYGKREVLEDMPPWQGGGNMIADVTFEKTVYHGPPTRFEAGTGNIADAVGLGAALEYVERVGIENIGRYEHGLLDYATHHMKPIPGVKLIGTAADKASVLSFVLDGYSTDEVGKALNEEGIAVRTGHHCAQPILRRFGLETTVRPSLAFYNTCEEVDRMVNVVRRLAGSRR
ncbi:MAG: SufS family cysteine desulfurase [Burkholderiaceae bacterium]|nr:SufS family cysteine desulfurase [Burkholderiaceae bacterium]